MFVNCLLIIYQFHISYIMYNFKKYFHKEFLFKNTLFAASDMVS